MNKQTPQHGADKNTEVLVEELFRNAAPRPLPPPADAEFIRQAVYEEWDKVVLRRRVSLRLRWLAAAASVLVMVGAAILALRPQLLFPDRAVLATVERAAGTFQVAEDGRQSTPTVAEGFKLLEGYTLSTGADTLVAMRMGSGGSLRLAAESTLELLGDDRVGLTRGTLYFDSWTGADQPGGHLSVVTSLGTVRDVGTQFVTRLSADALMVSVRQGLITVQRGGDEHLATVGERITLRGPGSPMSREAISTYGDDWRWVERIAPAFKVQGKRLIDVLDWFARETGRELEFGSLDAQRAAGGPPLHVSTAVELDRPTAALNKLLATADLEYRLVDAKIHITLRAR